MMYNCITDTMIGVSENEVYLECMVIFIWNMITNHQHFMETLMLNNSYEFDCEWYSKLIFQSLVGL